MRELVLWRWTLTVLLVAALVLVAVFVWPTRYRDDVASYGGVPVVFRTDRLSGKVEMLNPIKDYLHPTAAPPTRKP